MENGFDLWYYMFNESILLRSLSIEVVIYGDMYEHNGKSEIAEYVKIRLIFNISTWDIKNTVNWNYICII